MTKESSNTLLENIRNMPGKRKHLITGTSLALMLTFSSCWEKEQEVPKQLGDFEWVGIEKEGWEKWNIYKYNLKKWEYPFTVWSSFNRLDSTNGDAFASVGTKNILDKNKKGIKDKQTFQIWEIIYVKAKINKEKESEYIYSFDKPQNYDYRSKREQWTVKRIEKEVIIDGKKGKITIIKDAWLTFYVVQEKDFFPGPMIANWEKIKHCINFDKIISKLSQIEEFSYLKKPSYQRIEKIWKNEIKLKNKLISFNINPTDIEDISIRKIKEWKLLIPIPTPESERIMEIQEFAYYAQQAIREMENHPYYWSVMKELLTKVTKEEILEELLTFAYSESSPYWDKNIGKFELHRREWSRHKAFSFSYFHILMTKWSPWYKGRINLWLSEGECYHPKNATKLFLAFWAEKSQEMSKPLSDFFPLDNTMYEKVARTYNWWNYKKYQYDTKMKINHEIVIKKLKKYKQ
jgi:hypothetical protein